MRKGLHKTFNSSFILNLLKWVSEWLLFNVNSVIFQLYHGETKLILSERQTVMTYFPCPLFKIKPFIFFQIQIFMKNFFLSKETIIYAFFSQKSSRPALYITKKGALDSQMQVIKFTSCLPMVVGSLWVLRLLPPLKLVAMI
jgi:hypothetical protein